VLALLTHTVLPSDVWVFGVEAHVWIGLQDFNAWQQARQALMKTLVFAPSCRVSRDI
jgi:hypothetical protein